MRWVLLWSCAQDALHIEPLERMLAANRIACRNNDGGDYRLLNIGTREEVDAQADAMRPLLDRRRELRVAA